MNTKFLGLIIAGVAFCLSSQDANAAYSNRALRQKAVGSCQATQPSYDSQLRKRPVGILNIGQSKTFIACGVTTNVFADTTRVDIEFTNRSGVDVTVNCNLVTGSVMGTVKYFQKQISMPSGLAGTVLIWTSLVDNNDQPFEDVQAILCDLPPSVEINSTGVVYNEWSN